MFNLQKLRIEKGLTQKDAAILLGCKQPNISAIENSGKNPTPEQVEILISKYGEGYVMSLYDNLREELDIKSQNELNLESAFQIMKKQAESLNKKDEQIDRLISLLENQLNKQ
jgi:transcriptional regulator with XRE-family HTH domain